MKDGVEKKWWLLFDYKDQKPFGFSVIASINHIVYLSFY